MQKVLDRISKAMPSERHLENPAAPSGPATQVHDDELNLPSIFQKIAEAKFDDDDDDDGRSHQQEAPPLMISGGSSKRTFLADSDDENMLEAVMKSDPVTAARHGQSKAVNAALAVPTSS